jgi:chaperonin GroEL
MKERKDRYEDAVLAVACALEEGIVEGGGVALCRAHLEGQLYKDITLKNPSAEYKISYSILQPFKTIFPNCELGPNSDKDNYKMFEKNIIDPLKVTRCALENAVSVAKTVLSTDCIVLNPNQWN